MKRLLPILVPVILVAVGAVVYAAVTYLQPSSQLQINDAYANTEVFICLDHQGYSLVSPELLWSGPADITSSAVSPSGDIYVRREFMSQSAPPKYSLYKIEDGKAVYIADDDYNRLTPFSFDLDGVCYFAEADGRIFKSINIETVSYTTYYQCQSIKPPSNYLRGLGFGPEGTIYFADDNCIYKVENGVESLLYDFKTRVRELNLVDVMWSMAIDREGTIYFTSDVFFWHGEGGSRGFGPAGMVLQLTEEDEEQVVCAAINQEARGISIGPDNSCYILTWIAQSGGNLMQLWKLALKQGAISEEPFDYQGEHVIDESKLDSDEKTALPYVQKYAEEENVSPALLMAIIKQESSFNPDAIGDAGLAIGYMQSHWDAAYDAGYRSKRDTFESYSEESKGLAMQGWPADGLDPDANVKYGCSYLKVCYEKHKDSLIYDTPLKDAISAYNLGWPHGPDKSNETSYVNPILEYYEYYESKYVTTTGNHGAVSQRIVQTNANTLQSHPFSKKTRTGGVGFIVYTVTTGTVSDFHEETSEEGVTNGLSCLVSNESGNTTEVVVAIPKDVISKASRIRAEVGSTELGGDIVESESMYFVVVSYPQTQDLQRLTLSW
jgi:hypothetical protein